MSLPPLRVSQAKKQGFILITSIYLLIGQPQESNHVKINQLTKYFQAQ
jgi:hypothetical protein